MGLSAGSVFLDKNRLIYRVRGPGVKQEEKVFRMGRPRESQACHPHPESPCVLHP